MTGTEFWETVDKILKERHLTILDVSRVCGISSATLYSQRRRNQFPKMDILPKLEAFFGDILGQIKEDEKQYLYKEYVDALAQASEYQIWAVRRILGLPEKKAEN